MSCGCNNTGDNSPKKEYDRVSLNNPPCDPDSPVVSGCDSTKGLFYDKLTEDFTVPTIGSEGYIHICEASRYAINQFIAINLANNKIAVFKITARYAKKIRVLNGCDVSGVNPIVGNPPAGTVIPADSNIYAVAPTGCDSDLAQKIIETLEQYGADAVIQLLADQENICFTNIPEISEDEEVHLFGGSKPDCDCAPESVVSSCFRKILRIFTGNAGRTLCMPDVPQTSTDPEEGVQKRLALFDANKCLKQGPTFGELMSCENLSSTEDNSYKSIIACNEGESKVITPEKSFQTIISKNFGTDEDPDFRWTIQDEVIDYAVINYQTSSGSGGGDATSPPKNWYTRPLNTISLDLGDLVDLASNIITIKKPGYYRVSWSCVFQICGDFTTRLINTTDAGEVFQGVTGKSPTGNLTNALSTGTAFIEVDTTKTFKIEYRVETVGVGQNELGHPFNLGVTNIHAQVNIERILGR